MGGLDPPIHATTGSAMEGSGRRHVNTAIVAVAARSNSIALGWTDQVRP